MSTVATNLKYQVYNRRLGLWLFILSESVIFFTLLVTRFYMNGFDRPKEGVVQALGLAITSVLLLSSFFANRAETSIVHGDLAAFKLNIIVTIILGAAFLGFVVMKEWPDALKHFPPNTAYGTSFFALTGMHAFHVLTGLIMLILVFIQGAKGKLAEDHWAAEGAIIYWHFVDLVWVFVYPVLYLVGP
jgi:cytochrome c oxidase subunit 3